MNRFTLKFSNKNMESEYSKLNFDSITENIQLMIYFLALFQLSVGIPAIIDGNLLGFFVSLGVIGILICISCLRGVFLKYKQLIAYIIIAVFHWTRPYYVPNDIENNSKGVLLLRGYAIASLQLPLMSRFPELNQKLLGVIAGFGIRFLIMGFIDEETLDPNILVRHILIDIFLFYVYYCHERTERKLFQNFCGFRERLKKFKELVDNYLPQSIVVFNAWTNKCLFSNKASLNVFRTSSEPTSPIMSENMITSPRIESLKTEIDYLQIDNSTINILGPMPSIQPFSKEPILLKDLITQFAVDPLMDYKALSVSTSRTIDDSKQVFGVIMTKIKWDEENAVAIVLNDITYQENILSLKVADENKDKTLATVAHELRTPLNGIIGILEMAEAKINDLEVLEYLELCKDNAKLLLGLVNSILDLQQIKQGKLKLNITKVDIIKVLKDIVRLFHFQCNQKAIFLKLDVEKEIPTFLFTDENRLKQILINLVGNAIKFTSKGGITIGINHLTNENDCLNVWVSDTGIGIKEEDKEKLFKMYGKLEDGANINKNGVGLGLAISSVLAQLLSGRIDDDGMNLHSVYGEGTKFWFKLAKELSCGLTTEKSKNVSLHSNNFSQDEIINEFPQGFTIHTKITHSHSNDLLLKELLFGSDRDRLDTERIGLNVEERQVEAFSGTILVVDDNPFNLMIARNVIDKLGYNCETATNGHEAIDKVKAHAAEFQNYSIILMDQYMPIMDGIEATRILKEMMRKKEVPQIPIVALTANHDENSIKQCYECGMSDYLTKPLKKEDLRALIHKHN